MKLQSSASQNLLWQLYWRTIFGRDEAQRTGVKSRRVNKREPFSVWRPGRLDIPAIAPCQSSQSPAIGGHATDGALKGERNRTPIGRNGGLNTAKGATGGRFVGLSERAQSGEAPKPHESAPIEDSCPRQAAEEKTARQYKSFWQRITNANRFSFLS